MQKCLLDCLVRALAGGSRSLLPEVEIGGEECEGEGTDTEGHVEPAPAAALAATEPEPREGIAGGGLRPLTLRPRGHFVPGKLIFSKNAEAFR